MDVDGDGVVSYDDFRNFTEGLKSNFSIYNTPQKVLPLNLTDLESLEQSNSSTMREQKHSTLSIS